MLFCRYYDLKPKYDTAVIRINELEKEVEKLKNNACKQEEIQKNFYLQLYAKQEKSEQMLVGNILLKIFNFR